MSIQDQIRPVLEGPLTALGLVLEDVAVTPAGRRRLVRVYLDRALSDSDGDTTAPTSPLSLDEVSDATRVVSDELDSTDVMGEQPYVLEVTSLGVERPLRRPRHFRRNVSRLVTVTTQNGETLTGRIIRAGDESVTLEVPGDKKEPERRVEMSYAGLARAVVQVEFSRPDAGGDEMPAGGGLDDIEEDR
jgi:ribosome maturation factor RimP